MKRCLFQALAILLVLSACGTGIRSAPAIASTPTPASPPASDKITPILGPIDLLEWKAADAGECLQRMVINAYHELILKDCGGADRSIQPVPVLFQEMAGRFAPFTYKTDRDELIFRGQGEVSGEAWQHAIRRWTQMTFAQADTGHVCASCPTALAWNLGQVPDVSDTCRQLVVLNFGYAYAQKILCGSGQALEHTAAWLETDEWTKLDNWIINRSSLKQPEGYFTGEGSQAMSAEETAQLKALAESIYTRIAK